MREFFRKKLLLPLKNQLTQGATPKALAITCAVGATLAIFPLLGFTTFLCILVGVGLKLNQPILQAVNYLLYPIQILLIPVFLKIGEMLTGSEKVSFNPSTVVSEFMADPRIFLANYGMAGLHAVLVWMVLAPILAWIIYQISFKIFNQWRT
jgi:uncharacterized protein (DUF2062 family)